eukprot:2975250-Rhodomonas_salina.3
MRAQGGTTSETTELRAARHVAAARSVGDADIHLRFRHRLVLRSPGAQPQFGSQPQLGGEESGVHHARGCARAGRVSDREAQPGRQTPHMLPQPDQQHRGPDPRDPGFVLGAMRGQHHLLGSAHPVPCTRADRLCVGSAP